jgi:hypothetical protein
MATLLASGGTIPENDQEAEQLFLTAQEIRRATAKQSLVDGIMNADAVGSGGKPIRADDAPESELRVDIDRVFPRPRPAEAIKRRIRTVDDGPLASMFADLRKQAERDRRRQREEDARRGPGFRF